VVTDMVVQHSQGGSVVLVHLVTLGVLHLYLISLNDV
jgi:hypothetical protein